MTAAAQFWDHIAEDYAKRPLPQPEATARKLAYTRGLLRPDHRLLDLGCGTGTILLELAPSVAEAVGRDVSPAMIVIAERKAREALAAAEAAGAPAPGRVRFEAAPAGLLEGVPDATYDCVCAYNLLHLVPDPAALVGAIHRVLKPGGSIVTSTPCLGGTWLPPYPLILPVMRWLGKAPPVLLLTADELRRLHSEAGFVEIQAPDVGNIAPGVFIAARRSAGPGGG